MGHGKSPVIMEWTDTSVFIGFAGDEAPLAVVPAPEWASYSVGQQEHVLAWTHAEWREQVLRWTHTVLRRQVGLRPHAQPMVLLASPWAPEGLMDSLVDVLLRDESVPTVSCWPSPACAAAAQGLQSTVAVQIDWETTNVWVIVNDRLLPDPVSRVVPIGARHYLGAMIQALHPECELPRELTGESSSGASRDTAGLSSRDLLRCFYEAGSLDTLPPALASDWLPVPGHASRPTRTAASRLLALLESDAGAQAPRWLPEEAAHLGVAVEKAIAAAPCDNRSALRRSVLSMGPWGGVLRWTSPALEEATSVSRQHASWLGASALARTRAISQACWTMERWDQAKEFSGVTPFPLAFSWAGTNPPGTDVEGDAIHPRLRLLGIMGGSQALPSLVSSDSGEPLVQGVFPSAVASEAAAVARTKQ